MGNLIKNKQKKKEKNEEKEKRSVFILCMGVGKKDYSKSAKNNNGKAVSIWTFSIRPVKTLSPLFQLD